jgi:hypothetical protein
MRQKGFSICINYFDTAKLEGDSEENIETEFEDVR